MVIVRLEPVRMIAWPLANDSSKVKAARAIVKPIVIRAAVAQIIAFICLFFLFVVGFAGGGY